MSSSSTNLQNKLLPSETERSQRLPDVDTQQLKMRERQRFFEEVFQHDVDVYLSSAHLCIRDYKRPPIGSISSMEVNVDLLDQMELVDISDQDALDVFFSSGGEEGALNSPLPQIQANNNHDDHISNGLFRHVLEARDSKPRMSSTSSTSSCDSQITTTNGGNTPVVRSEDEEAPSSVVRRRATPAERNTVKSQTASSSS